MIDGDAQLFAGAGQIIAQQDTVTINGANMGAGHVGLTIGVEQLHDLSEPAFRSTIKEIIAPDCVRIADAAPHDGVDLSVIVGTDRTEDIKDALALGDVQIDGHVLASHIPLDGVIRRRISGVNNATIYRMPDIRAGTFGFSIQRLFNVSNGAELTLFDLTLHGTRNFQTSPDGGSWQNDFANQHWHLIHVEFAKISVSDCRFFETPGDGVSCFRKSNVTINGASFYNCFRGGVTVIATSARLFARDIQSDDDMTALPLSMFSGLYFEPEPSSANDGVDQVVDIDGWRMEQGILNISTLGNTPTEIMPYDYKSRISIRNLHQGKDNIGPRSTFFVSNNCRVDVSDSTLVSGPTADTQLQLFGGNVHFARTQFIASMKGIEAPQARALVLSRSPIDANNAPAALSFDQCEFVIGHDVPDTSAVSGIIWYDTTTLMNTQPILTMLPPPSVVFTNSMWHPRIQGQNYRLFDQAVTWQDVETLDRDILGHLVFDHCSGTVKTGLRLKTDRLAYVTVRGTTWNVTEDFIYQDDTPSPDKRLVLNWDGLIVDAANSLVGGSVNGLYPYGYRLLIVPADPTLPAPVQVTDISLEIGQRKFQEYRLSPGKSIVPGSVLIEETRFAGGQWHDQGDGTLSGSGGSGTIDYATGLMSLVYANSQHTAAVYKATYQYDGGIDGAAGDIAVLRDGQQQKWKCITSGSPGVWVIDPSYSS